MKEAFETKAEMLGSITILCTVSSLAFRVSGYSYSVGEVATA